MKKTVVLVVAAFLAAAMPAAATIFPPLPKRRYSVTVRLKVLYDYRAGWRSIALCGDPQNPIRDAYEGSGSGSVTLKGDGIPAEYDGGVLTVPGEEAGDGLPLRGETRRTSAYRVHRLGSTGRDDICRRLAADPPRPIPRSTCGTKRAKGWGVILLFQSGRLDLLAAGNDRYAGKCFDQTGVSSSFEATKLKGGNFADFRDLKRGERVEYEGSQLVKFAPRRRPRLSYPPAQRGSETGAGAAHISYAVTVKRVR